MRYQVESRVEREERVDEEDKRRSERKGTSWTGLLLTHPMLPD